MAREDSSVLASANSCDTETVIRRTNCQEEIPRNPAGAPYCSIAAHGLQRRSRIQLLVIAT